MTKPLPTSSRFNAGALKYARGVPEDVVLRNGQGPTELMIEHGAGVQAKRTVKIVEIDEGLLT